MGGGQCADAYFKAFYLSGRGVEEQRHNGSIHAGVATMISVDAKEKQSRWLQMGPMGLRVAWGHTNDGIEYLNLYLRHVAQVHYRIGGLLGNGDHTTVSTPNVNCKKSVSLLRQVSLLGVGVEEPLGSVAEVSWE